MAKHGLSVNGLRSVFDKLLKAGFITQVALDQHRLTGDQLKKPVPAKPTEESPQYEKTWDILEEFAGRFKIPREDLERLKRASAKDIKDFLTRHNISLAETGPLLKALGKTGLMESIQKIQTSWGLGRNPVKLLAMAGAAFMVGWFVAGLLTTSWLWFLVCLILLTCVFSLASHFAEKSTLKSYLTVKNLVIVGTVFLALNVALFALRPSPRVVVVKHEIRSVLKPVGSHPNLDGKSGSISIWPLIVNYSFSLS